MYKSQFLNSPGDVAAPAWVVVAVACDVRRVRRVGVGLLMFGCGVVGGVWSSVDKIMFDTGFFRVWDTSKPGRTTSFSVSDSAGKRSKDVLGRKSARLTYSHFSIWS